MASPDSPHDKLFRALVEDPGRAGVLLHEALPAELAAQLADTPPVLLDGSFVDAALRGSQSDRLFRVTLKTGALAYVYTLLEHKSTPDPHTPIKLLGYMARIWERHLEEQPTIPNRLPAIIPLVVYHGRAPWRVPTAVPDWIAAEGALAEIVRDFRYILHDLGPLEYPELSRDRALRAGLAALKYAYEKSVPLAMVVALLQDTPEGSKLERQILEYVARVYEMTRAEMERALIEAKPHRREELMGTPAEEWIAEGEAKGKAEALLRVLQNRFGPLSDDLAARLRRAEVDTLDLMLDRALTVERPEDVLRPSR